VALITSPISNIRAARDVIVGDQKNYYSDADLSRVEALLAQIVALLREPHATIRVEGDVRDSVIVVGGSSNTVSFAPRDLPLLRALPTTDARRREEIYLTELILDETHARWDRLYLPLAGRLGPAQMPSDAETLQPNLRLGVPVVPLEQCVGLGAGFLHGAQALFLPRQFLLLLCHVFLVTVNLIQQSLQKHALEPSRQNKKTVRSRQGDAPDVCPARGPDHLRRNPINAPR
jgi:hypothetical protein